MSLLLRRHAAVALPIPEAPAVEKLGPGGVAQRSRGRTRSLSELQRKSEEFARRGEAVARITLGRITCEGFADVGTLGEGRATFGGLSSFSMAETDTVVKAIARLGGLEVSGVAGSDWQSCIAEDDEFLLMDAA